MEINKSQLNEDIFDLVLKKALIEDCEKELKHIISQQLEQEHIFNEAFTKRISKLDRTIKRQIEKSKNKITIPKSGLTAAVVLLCIIITANTPVGASFKSFFAKVFDTYTQYEFHDKTIITLEGFNNEIKPEYIPEGYYLRQINYGFGIKDIVYEDNYNEIIIVYAIANSVDHFIDNEHSIVKDILINGKIADFYETTDESRPSYLIWVEKGYSFVITAQLNEKEFVKIAESIKIF